MAAQLTHDLELAARRLAQGGLVAFPTETVYGLGADAGQAQAVAQIYAAKGRPAGHPLIVHLAPDTPLASWAAHVPKAAHRLVEAFWPGPLTLILPRAAHVSVSVTGGQDTVGLRCPSHPVAQALLTQFARLTQGPAGVAAPSANLFGQVSPTSAQHVLDEFRASTHDMLVLDGEPSQVGIESTILDVSRLEQGVGPVLLRPGHITADQIAAVLGQPVQMADAEAPRVSGSLKAHYAPRTPLRVLSREQLTQTLAAWQPGHGRAVAWCLDAQGLPSAEGVEFYPAPVQAQAYAQQLYARLRSFDESGRFDVILLEMPPSDGEWAGVADRLKRAAAAFDDPSL